MVRKKITCQQDYKDYVFSMVGNEYTVLSDYIDSKTKIKMIHNSCKNIFEIKPNDFQQRKRCNLCGLRRKSQEQFDMEISNLSGNEYTFLEPYKNSRTKIRVRHNKCGHVFKITPNHFIVDFNRCPICRESKGEQKIHKWLHTNKIHHNAQKKFKTCKHKNCLPFDFLIKYNKKFILIEFNGEQHYKPSFSKDPIKANEKFLSTKRNDLIKKKWCKLKNIPLLTIPYWKFNNIEDVLEAYLEKFND